MSTDDGLPPVEDGDMEQPSQAPGFAGLSGFGTMGPLSGFGELFGQARDQLEQASFEAANVKVSGRAGGGAVEIELTGNLDAVSVKIAREVVDPDDVGMLEDLVLAALRHALAEAVEVREHAASTLLPPGLDLGAMMSSLFGGGAGGSPDLSALGGLAGLAGAGGVPPLEGLMSELFGGDFALFEQDGDEESGEDEEEPNDDDTDDDADDELI
ncbi:MAG: YbaB/EbfC family nucleoid-associated protein [Acidimicrobiales bacterium]|jgi:DNA-binding YbaB/EbfC family protein